MSTYYELVSEASASPSGGRETSSETVAAADARDAATELRKYERIIAQGLKHYEQVANALLEIQERKLYRPRYRAFGTYLQERWHMSRSRAYQLIHFARVKRLSTTVDAPGPQNERQARTSGVAQEAAGPKESDSFSRNLRLLAQYVLRCYENAPEDRKWDVVLRLRNLSHVYEGRYYIDHPDADPPNGNFQNEPNPAAESARRGHEQIVAAGLS